jgi:hypothetical protein
MIDGPRRRFNLSDISILIAATALGLVAVRYVLALDLLNSTSVAGSRANWHDLAFTLAMNLASPVLVALSLAAFVLGLRPPRRSTRLLARDPGFVAMSVVVATTAYYLVHLAMRVIANYYSDPPLSSTHIIWFMSNLFVTLGWNIAIAWFVLALQGNWQSRPIRDGGLAAALGCTWIVVGIAVDLRQFARMIYVNYF